MLNRILNRLTEALQSLQALPKLEYNPIILSPLGGF